MYVAARCLSRDAHCQYCHSQLRYAGATYNLCLRKDAVRAKGECQLLCGVITVCPFAHWAVLFNLNKMRRAHLFKELLGESKRHRTQVRNV